MSPNVGNFVHDLVEMAKAMETLPQVQAELTRANEQVETYNNRITSILADLEQSRTYAASLEQKVRTVEAERDDAEIRFLELDEKAHKISAVLDTIASSAMGAFDQLTPPKPQSVLEPIQPPVPEVVQSIEPQPQGQGEAFPTTHGIVASSNSQDQTSASDIATHSENVSTSTAMGEVPQPTASQDQGEVNPTSSQTGSSMDTLGDAEPKLSGPYTGKRYHDHPVYVNYWDWIDGGGTEEGYRWYPDVGSSA